jgi:hypothetical protein
MPRIKVDIDLLLEKAGDIHQAAAEINHAGDDLAAEALRNAGGDPSTDLQASVRGDVFAAAELIHKLERGLSAESEKLAALSRAFRSVDEETIGYLNRMTESIGLAQSIIDPRKDPDLEGFERYDPPRTAMAISNWAVMYNQNLKTALHTFTFGEMVGNIIGAWTDPKTGIAYEVVDLGNGRYGYIPASRLSGLLDYSKIPIRDELFTDGQKVFDPDLPAPWGTGLWPPELEWNSQNGARLSKEWHKQGDPWQNLILGDMKISGLGPGKFPTTAHANLCGELSVLFAVGETDLEAGLSKFAQLTGLGYWDQDGNKVEYTGTQVLQNPNHPTSAYDLARLFAAYGYQRTCSSGVLPTPDTLAEQLASGHQFIFLAELDTLKEIPSKESGAMTANPTYGKLVCGAPPNTPGRAAHWVAVTDVFQDKNGDLDVEVFNPYSGLKETYSWDTFVKTCQHPGNSGGSFEYVEAWKELPNDSPPST